MACEHVPERHYDLHFTQRSSAWCDDVMNPDNWQLYVNEETEDCVDPSFSLLIHDKLQVPNSTRKAWNERDGRCDVCSTHLSQLKQEAVHMVLSLDQCDVSPGSPPSLASLVSSRSVLQGPTPPRDWSYLPPGYHPSASSAPATVPAFPSSSTSTTTSASNSASPHHLTHPKHGSKPNTLGVSSGVEKKNNSPGLGGKSTASQQPHPLGSPSNSNGTVLSSTALQTQQYVEGAWTAGHLSRANGVTLYPYQISQMVSEGNREGLNEAALNRYNADRPIAYSSPPAPAPATTAPSSGTSAAASFFARAAQKLNLSSKKKKQRPAPPVACDPPLFPTNFSGILQVSPPPAPPCLLRAVNKVKDTPGMGKVKVMVRVCPSSPTSAAESSSFLKVDSRKKQVTILDPAANSQPNQSQKRGTSNQVPPKMFAFDAAFSHDASQAEVCAGTVAEVIQSVVNGADGCVFCFGHSKLGKSYTMIGKDESMQSLGIIPCAISWLFKLINECKEKTGARFSVRVSAVEVWGKDENLKDLLSEVATGSLQDGQSPGVYLCEDPICGMQLQNQSELRAPTAEKAAFFLDAAIAARYSSKPDCDEEEHRNSHMLFTLHIYQYRMEKTGKGGMSGGRSRLHLIDLGSCVKVLSKTRDSTTGPCLSLSALGNVIMALVNGSKHIPYKDSKLTMLLRESLGNMNCRTTMIAHISLSPNNFSETLSSLQIASRVLRLKKKKAKQYTSSSSGGESSCEEGRMRRPTQLRTIHSRNVVDSEMPLLHLSSDPDDYSSSEQSCDTVIYVGPNGSALSDKELTDNEGPPEFVPIIPSLHTNIPDPITAPLESQPSQQQAVAQIAQASQHTHPQPLPPVPEEGPELGKKEKDCLKCNTFAELQERLDCIDGREEVTEFPFEEAPANKAAKFEPGQAVKESQQSSSPKRISNDQQLEEIREVVEEAEIALSIIESLAQCSTGSCGLSTSRSVTGSSGIGQLTPLQRAKSSSLHDSRESISGGSSSEGKTRPMGSPRLGIASLTKTAEYKSPSSPSQRCKVYTQKGIMPSTPPHSSQNLFKDSRKSSMESLLNPESRTSPVGMSPKVLRRSSSCNSIGSSETLCDDVPQLPMDGKDLKNNAATVTLQQPLEPNGEDELVFTLVEKRTIKGAMDNGRPTSIISFNSDCSAQAVASRSRPVSIISSMSVDLEHYTTDPCTTTATISEVNIAKFLPLNKNDGEVQASRRSSISSWLSEMSTGSDVDQSSYSLVAQQCFGQGEVLAEDRLLKIQEEVEFEGVPESNGQRNSKKDLNKTDNVNDKNTPTNPKPDKSFSASSGFVPFKTNVTTQPCAAVKPMLVQDLQAKSPPIFLSSELKFVDPWMKREGDEESNPKEIEAKSEKPTSESVKRKCILDKNSNEAVYSPDSMNRVVDGCEVVFNASESITQVYSADIFRTGSLPRAWHRVNKQDDLEDSTYRYTSGEYKSLGVTTSTPCSPRATLERKSSVGRPGFFSRQKGIPPLPPIRKSSLDQRNRASPQHNPGNTHTPHGSTPEDLGGKHKTPNVESSRLFSAKLEQLANRTNSLGRSHGVHYDCFSLERAESLTSLGCKGGVIKDSTMPRAGRSINRCFVSSPTNGPNGNNNTPQSPKASQSKISAVSKLLMASPKARSLSTSSTKTLSFSTKSLPQTVNRSSSLPPNGKNQNQNSWSTQSLSRSRGTGLASKLPLRAVNGRISELLQSSAISRASQGRGASDAEDKGAAAQGEERPVVQTLPSPYSKITAPRRPYRCSSGHASDNSSVLSGELPPAMGKTALFYHSGGSSGYESMIRDSEATGSTSSAQDSMSENSSSISGRRSLKNSKKRSITGKELYPIFQHRKRLHAALTVILNETLPFEQTKQKIDQYTLDRKEKQYSNRVVNAAFENKSRIKKHNRSLQLKFTSTATGTQRRRLIPNLTLDTSSPVRKPIISPGVRWVDGPLRPAQRGLTEPFEIKVYEIDDVERLQRRRTAGNKEELYFSAKLKILEHRQQRISEVRAKYDWLKKELEQTKQHLMLEPEKWTTEFDLQQTFEVDSLEYLEALEFVTERLENRVNFCKAHLMMITCFDITCRRR
ncbi:Kinesin-like protein KIF26B [Triplophysa tibetana]|uniref:Kinesin-like protein KIF26B n=1 Tax=Triplophysa tibetana TaxID=1572043 RepID=A0A5A9NPU0_9TELE|nr:Kinesin-like protein KIF26B [Triplophysa tibetana]